MKQSCPLGLTRADLREVLGDRFNDFSYWMRGQTVGVCEGWEYSYSLRRYFPSECADTPHWVVTYPGDVKRFLAGLPVTD